MKQKITITSIEGQIISGQVSFSKNKDCEISISGRSIFEVKSRMSPEQIELSKFEVSKPFLCKANQLYTIPFSFELDVGNGDTHSISKVQKNYLLELTILEDKYHKEVVKQYFNVKRDNYYKVVSSRERVRLDSPASKFPISYIIAPFLVFIFLFIRTKIPFLDNALWIAFSAVKSIFIDIPLWGLFMLFVFLPVCMFIISYNRRGKNYADVGMWVETAHNGDKFKIKLDYNKFNFKIKSIAYSVIESVLDTRGTSTRYYDDLLYQSPDISRSGNLVFDYPNQNGLQTAFYADSRIIWRVTIEGRPKGNILNRKIKYIHNFRVNSIDKSKPVITAC